MFDAGDLLDDEQEFPVLEGFDQLLGNGVAGAAFLGDVDGD